MRKENTFDGRERWDTFQLCDHGFVSIEFGGTDYCYAEIVTLFLLPFHQKVTMSKLVPEELSQETTFSCCKGSQVGGGDVEDVVTKSRGDVEYSL